MRAIDPYFCILTNHAVQRKTVALFLDFNRTQIMAMLNHSQKIRNAVFFLIQRQLYRKRRQNVLCILSLDRESKFLIRLKYFISFNRIARFDFDIQQGITHFDVGMITVARDKIKFNRHVTHRLQAGLGVPYLFFQ